MATDSSTIDLIVEHKWRAAHNRVYVKVYSTTIREDFSEEVFSLLNVGYLNAETEINMILTPSIDVPGIEDSFRCYKDGMLVNVIAHKTIKMDGQFLLFSAPYKEESSSNRSTAVDAINSVAGFLTVTFGPGATLDVISEFDLHLDSESGWSIQSEVIEIPWPLDISRIDCSIHLKDENKRVSNEAKSALQMVHLAYRSTETSIRLFLLWTAVDMLFKNGKDRKRFLEAVNLSELSEAMDAVWEKRGNLFHEGQKVSLTSEEERYLCLLIFLRIISDRGADIEVFEDTFKRWRHREAQPHTN